MYGPSILQLAQFKRATLISANYQQFRITGVKYRFTPRFDTFPGTTDITNQISVPYLYYMIDRTNVIKPNATLQMLQSMGAKPNRFDDKTVMVKYRPGVLASVDSKTTGLALANKPYISPWLSTMDDPDNTAAAPSLVNHFGLWYMLDAKGLPGDGQYEYDVDIEVNFQFRKPLTVIESPATVPPKAVIPVIV